MSGFWQISSRAVLGAPATASQASPAASSAGGQQVRLRALQCFLAGAGSGADELVVRDGASGVGAVIWAADLSSVANGAASVFLSGLDLRASVGNSLTIEFVTGVVSNTEDVNAQGDFVPAGYPLGMT